MRIGIGLPNAVLVPPGTPSRQSVFRLPAELGNLGLIPPATTLPDPSWSMVSA